MESDDIVALCLASSWKMQTGAELEEEQAPLVLLLWCGAVVCVALYSARCSLLPETLRESTLHAPEILQSKRSAKSGRSRGKEYEGVGALRGGTAISTGTTSPRSQCTSEYYNSTRKCTVTAAGRGGAGFRVYRPCRR